MKKYKLIDYIIKIEKAELEFKKNKVPAQPKVEGDPYLKGFKLVKLLALSLFDLFCLILNSFKNSEQKTILYLARNFTVLDENGNLYYRLPLPVIDENTILINHSKIDFIRKVNNKRVYNIGHLIKFISLFYINKEKFINHFCAYKKINEILVLILKPKSIITLCFYDMNGLSLIFSKCRSKFELIEIQHGSIINYPPYLEPCIYKPADTFYVKNIETIAFLKANLAKNFECKYELIKYPEVPRMKKPGINILYASTIEFNGFHPVFIKFLKEQTLKELNLIIRLHPREREKEDIFRSFISKFDVKFEFDNSKNWLESNVIENLFVVSPWSSTIEDAYDNGYISIIIDPVGKERYSHLINGKSSIYTDDLIKTLTELTD